MIDMNNYSVEELEEIVKDYSFPYKDSSAFVSALNFIKDNDIVYYKELLYRECVDCGYL